MVEEAGQTLSGSSDLPGLQAVMYREGTHISSVEAFNAVNTRQGLLSRMNGSMWRQPWITSCRPHTLLTCSNIYVQGSSVSNWFGFKSFIHITQILLSLRVLGSPPPMLTLISSFSLLSKLFCTHFQFKRSLLPKWTLAYPSVHTLRVYVFIRAVFIYGFLSSSCRRFLKRKRLATLFSRKIPRTCFY